MLKEAIVAWFKIVCYPEIWLERPENPPKTSTRTVGIPTSPEHKLETLPFEPTCSLIGVILQRGSSVDSSMFSYQR
jgi:hypothetical protein